MKLAEELLAELNITPFPDNIEIVQKYLNQVVDLCVGSFECEMEYSDGDRDVNVYRDFNDNYVYPVLNRSSILEVKEKIK